MAMITIGAAIFSIIKSVKALKRGQASSNGSFNESSMILLTRSLRRVNTSPEATIKKAATHVTIRAEKMGSKGILQKEYV